MRYLALLPLLFACHSNEAACTEYVELLAECHPGRWAEVDPVEACDLWINIAVVRRNHDRRRGVWSDRDKWECVMHYACDDGPEGLPGFQTCSGQLMPEHRDSTE